MWQSTRLMAEAICRGIQSVAPDKTVKVMSVSKYDKNDVMTEVFHSCAVLVGSPTVNYGYTYATAGTLEMMRGLKFKGRKAAAFGSYGWSGDAPKMISDHLAEAGFEIVSEPLKTLWVPDEAALAECEAYGADFARKVFGL